MDQSGWSISIKHVIQDLQTAKSDHENREEVIGISRTTDSSNLIFYSVHNRYVKKQLYEKKISFRPADILWSNGWSLIFSVEWFPITPLVIEFLRWLWILPEWNISLNFRKFFLLKRFFCDILDMCFTLNNTETYLLFF